MKIKTLYFALAVLCLSCSGGSDDGGPSPTNPIINQPPTKVGSLISPENNIICISSRVTFKWSTAEDPEGQPFNYVLEISKDNAFSTLEEEIITGLTSKAVLLEKGVYYYWRVKAVDNEGASGSYSSVFNFYTEGEGETNHLPFQPQAVFPKKEDQVDASSVTLQWTANDLDNDPLTYDVYLDISNPPTKKVAADIDTPSLTVSLEDTTTYFWKIIAKDNNSGITHGEVWTFMTN